MLQATDLAPEIVLPDQTGAVRRLSSFRGSWVLVYFYPKDDTPGCTIESCGFRDLHPEFEKRRCVILGISADSVESHERFAGKHALPFMLLADTERAAIDDYGAWKDKAAKTGILRTSFLVDPEGRIAAVYDSVATETHPAHVLKDLDALQAAA